MTSYVAGLVVSAGIGLSAMTAWADVSRMGPGLTSLETVTVGNPGNMGVTVGGDTFGSVSYEYQIGKYEVTNAQYVEFLNAVAATDTYGLYNENMWDKIWSYSIQRTGSSGNYSYNVSAGRENCPVENVCWGDAARFANWLHNGQPTGAQDLSTTEDGSYYLNGATGSVALVNILRESDATWVIPSEDEWFKAAYHKNNGLAGEYWYYPTRSNTPPNNVIEPIDPGNSANIHVYKGDYTVGPPYYTTEVGEFENSASPYGTFDQGGNVSEWNEAVVSRYSMRIHRGGSARSYYGQVSSHTRGFHDADYEVNWLGFRVASVPEPGSITLLLTGALGLLLYTRRRR